MLSDSVSAISTNEGLQVVQQPETTLQQLPPDAGAAIQQANEARQLEEEAKKLSQQGTEESQKQAIAKYEAALQIWHKLGDRNSEANTITSIAFLYVSHNDYQKALEYYNQALALTRELKDQIAEADALKYVAETYFNLGETQKALSYYNQALSLFHVLKQPDLEAYTLIGIGGVYKNLGETQKALDSYNQALKIRREQKDLAGQAQTLEVIGSLYTDLSESQKALEAFHQALEIRRAMKNLTGQANILDNISTVYASLGQYNKALDLSQQALELQRQAQKHLSGQDLQLNLIYQAGILSGIASSYFVSGEFQKALDYENQALVLYQKAGLRSGEAYKLSTIGAAYGSLGETNKALDFLNQALQLHRDIQDRTGENGTLRAIAEIYKLSGNYQQALEFYNQALIISRQVSNPTQEASTLFDTASVYNWLGEYKLAIETYNQALNIFQQIGVHASEAQTLGEIGDVYRAAENYPKALDYYNQSLGLSRKQGNFLNEFSVLIGSVRVYEALKNYPKAFDVANQVLALSRQQKNSLNSETTSLALLARVHQASGNYQKALDLFTQVAAEFHKLGQPYSEANVLGNIGTAYESLKQPLKAISTYKQELKLWQKLGYRANEAYAFYEIAVTQRDRGNLKSALTNIEATIQIFEQIRSQVTSQELRTSYFAKVHQYYQFYIDLLMQLHKQNPSKGYNALALHISERSRARSLLELLTEANAKIRKGVDPKLLAQEQSLQEQIDAIAKLRQDFINKSAPATAVQKLEQQITNLLSQYQQLQTKIRTTSPKYAALKYPDPLKLPQIQQQLDSDSVLLQYSLGKEHSYLWAVTPNSLDSYELPPQDQIEKAADDFRQNLVKPFASDQQQVTTAKQLSQIILAPVANKLANKRLVIVADGALQNIPFAALTEPTAPEYQPLLVNHEIVNLPSASTIAILRQETQNRPKAPKALAILADPVFSADDSRMTLKPESNSITPELELQRSALSRSARNLNRNGWDRLTGTREEAQAILKLGSPKASLAAFDFDANYNWVTNPQLSQYRVIHLATHGFADDANPELSGIVLSLVDKVGKPQRGYLRLNDIFNLDFPADLVVLSACETGQGKEIQGEGLVGLTRGLMYAGSPRVVVSLWSVDDQGTKELMTQFYRQMWQQGKSPVAALRAAQLSLWQNPDWRKPVYWAAFTLQGEWR